jgi:hypothetical protein
MIGKNLIVTVIGVKGSGKTCMIRELCADLPRLLVYDPRGQLPECGVVFMSIGEVVEYLRTKDNFKKRYRVVFQPLNDGETLQFFLIAAQLRDYVLAVDEGSMIASPTSINPQFDHIIRYGRHDGVSVLSGARRAAELPRILTSQSDAFIVFKQHEPRDVEWLTDAVGSETAKSVQDLQGHDRVVFWPGRDNPGGFESGVGLGKLSQEVHEELKALYP